MLMTLNQMILTVTLTLLTLEADDVFDWVLVTSVLQKNHRIHIRFCKRENRDRKDEDMVRDAVISIK